MTNKEAIERLNLIQERCYNGYDAEALNLAIKALERTQVKYPKADSHKAYWDNVGKVDMRGEEDFTSISTGYSTFSAEENKND